MIIFLLSEVYLFIYFWYNFYFYFFILILDEIIDIVAEIKTVDNMKWINQLTSLHAVMCVIFLY